MSVIHWKNDLITNFDTVADWTGDDGPWIGPDAISSSVGVRLEAAAFTPDVAEGGKPKLTTLVGFDGGDGSSPNGGLIADAAGDLFGTTLEGGTDEDGTVFEITKTKGGYAGAPILLASFNGADGRFPAGGLLADAAGDLFGVTSGGPGNSNGTVFEITKTRHGYAGAPTSLVSFNGANGAYPIGGLISDAAGNLFGTTRYGGTDNAGTVFEVVKTRHGYAGAPTSLVSFTGVDGSGPVAGLITDAAGDLFATTFGGGADDDGTVFEVAKTEDGYASTPTVLASFTGADGAAPAGGLIADAAGDLFGTTYQGGADDDGTVFEIVKTKHGYADAPTILVSFDGADGQGPTDSLIADADGDLFGTAGEGGFANGGTLFELVKTKDGYASAPTILVKFNRDNGSTPNGSLLANAAGDLFGTTSEFFNEGAGTVFELTHSGFAPPTAPVAPAADLSRSPPPAAAFVQAMASHRATGPGSSSLEMHPSRRDASPLLSRPQVA